MDDFKQNILEEEFSDILGQQDVKDQLKSALLMDRHVILVGAPGVGKTTLAKSLVHALPEVNMDEGLMHGVKETGKVKAFKGSERFIRVQGSPDLTAEDLLGDIDPVKAMKHGALSLEAFSPGKIFKANQGILFFDEVNRCSEKLQNALLQVLEEGTITIGSYTIDFPASFIFIGTMNPEDSSTEPLSDVFLDRFDLIYVDYPESQDIEMSIVTGKGTKMIEFPEKLLHNTVRFIRELRESHDLEKKPSVRATLGLYERAQSHAVVMNKTIVEPSDIKAVLVSVLSHRIRLKPSLKYIKKPEDFIRQKFDEFQDSGGYL
ncbi:MAG: ATP-binding protein [Candidatus Woesearchaeota archaeon]